MIGLVLTCLGVFFLALGSFGIIDPGDGYFSEATREMVERGDYVTPHLNYQVYFSKPIMIYWLIASAYHMFGISELSARLWPALLTTALVLSTYWTARSVANWRVGLFAGLILATSPLVVTFARLSMVDAPFSSFVGIAVNALVMTSIAGSRRWWPVFWASLALSVLTKGPVGLVLIAGSSLVFLIVTRPPRRLLSAWTRRLHPVLGTVMLLSIILPWHVAVWKATDGLFLKVFYLYENLGRFKGQTNHEHREPWFYLLTLAYGFAPWVLFLPAALARAFNTGPSRNRAQRWAVAFYACFALSVLGFFTLSVAKLQTYILPAFPPLAFLTALLLDQWTQRRAAPESWLRVTSRIFAILGLAALVGGPIALFVVKHVPLWAKLTGIVASLAIAFGWIMQLNWLKRGQTVLAVSSLVATTVVATVLLTPVAFDVGYRYRQSELHTVIRVLEGRQANVAFFQEFKPGVMFYLHQPVDSFFSPDQLIPSAPGSANMQYVIAGTKSVAQLMASHGDKIRPLAVKGHWGVYEARGLYVRKLPTLEETFRSNLKLDSGRYTWGTLPFAGGKPPWELSLARRTGM